MDALQALALAKKYTAETMQGAGAIKGDDGFSPTVSISTIDGGHRVTITDATGTNTFDVMDGSDGGVDLSNYYTKSEVDSKINPTWVAYSPEEYVLDGVNDTYAMWIDNSRFSTPAAVGSYGMVIAKGQAGTDGTEAKNWIFVGEVLLPNSPIEGKTFVQVKFPLEIGGGEVANELITIKNTKVTNTSQLPEDACCVHAINSEIGFLFTDDIIYVKPLGTEVEIYTIDGSFATINADPDTGNFVTGSPVGHWAKETEVYTKSQVDEKISDLLSFNENGELVVTIDGVSKTFVPKAE